MPSSPPLCLYCNLAMGPADPVALCGACWAVVHDGCLRRSGRCSSVQCPGDPATMVAADVAVVVGARIAAANAEPATCPECGGVTEFGCLIPPARRLWLRRTPGIWFEPARESAPPARRRSGWHVAGAGLPGRRCRSCRALYLAGLPLASLRSPPGPALPYCPRCGAPFASGCFDLRRYGSGAVGFVPQAPPGTSEVRGYRATPDRFALGGGAPPAATIAGQCCPRCRFSLIAGLPMLGLDPRSGGSCDNW
ncbi:MAG: hypothetical protein NT029_05925 [Armatimonadetes bacterium]|nr:hypothetical protein [Armatimonadota bacterium]